MFSRRTAWPLEANTITATLTKLRGDGAEIIDLTESNPTRCGFAYPTQALLNPLAAAGGLVYDPQPLGNLKAREAVARYYQEKDFSVPAPQICLTASTSEGYSYLFRLLADPGERILFPRPSYPLFHFLGDLNDIQLDFYPLRYEGHAWRIDFEALEALIQSDTKAIVLVNPNNPTGSFIKEKEMQTLNAVCRKHHLALIADEVFGDFVLGEKARPVSLAENAQVLTFTLGGLSKTLGLPQMKLAWLTVSGPDETVKAALERLEMIADTYLSVNIPVQNALGTWLPLRAKIQSLILERIRRNWKFLKDTCPHQIFDAEGGWYAVLRIPPTFSEEEWVLKFLKEARVFVHPGYFFDFEEEGFAVVSLLPPEEAFQEGVRRLLALITGAAVKP